MNSTRNFSPAPHVCSGRCDALIIGGGPAGLAAAIALRQHGLDVLVLEALHPPIDKACGEGLMPDSRKELSRLGVELTGGREFSGIQFANRNAGREDLATAEFSGGRGVGIRRVELHQRLIDRAEEIGVALRWGVRADLPDAGEVMVDGKPIRYRYLIGADGQGSRVRRWAGLEGGPPSATRFGFRRHYRLQPWSERVEVHWGQIGQVYITPVGEDEVCVAAISRHRGVSFDSILEGMLYLQQALRGAEVMGRDRGAGTTTRRLRRVTRGNVALIGDASGSADAITGEGLASAFRQALLLGEALDGDRLGDYETGHARILRLPHAMASVMLTMDRWPVWRNRVMRTLSGSPELFAASLAVHVGELGFIRFAARHGLPLALSLLISEADRPVAAQDASHRAASNAGSSTGKPAPGHRPLEDFA